MKLLYENLDFEVERDQRIVLVGPNGAGKSTLLKLLAEVLKPISGVHKLGHNTKYGYFAQHRAAMLNPKHTVFQEAMDTPQRITEQAIRTVLGSFLFRGDDIYKPVSVLSGGEKSRLALVKLLLDPPNLLLMDEPTTHLDLASVDALIEALKQYQGTLVFISHDVHFIRALSTHVVRVEAGHAPAFWRRLPILFGQDGAVGALGADQFQLQQKFDRAKTRRAASRPQGAETPRSRAATGALE